MNLRFHTLISQYKNHQGEKFLDDSFCNFSNKGEIELFVESFVVSVGCLYVQPTITLVDFEHIIYIKDDQIFLGHRVLGHSLVDKKVVYLYKEVFHQLTN